MKAPGRQEGKAVAVWRRGAVALLVLPALVGCGEGLQFRNDHRLDFQAPEARARVSAPVQVSWTMTGFTASGLDGSRTKDRGAFAVFVDRAPMPVGKDLRWIFRKDGRCHADASCPTTEQLSERGVLVTTRTSVTIDVLPRVPSGTGDEQHYVNVVLLDGTGRRIGESGWYLPFSSKRRPA